MQPPVQGTGRPHPRSTTRRMANHGMARSLVFAKCLRDYFNSPFISFNLSANAGSLARFFASMGSLTMS